MIKFVLRLLVLALVLGGLTLGVHALTCEETPAQGRAPVPAFDCSA